MSAAVPAMHVWVLGEALMDCMAQPDGSLRPLMGGSPFNLARAAALRGADVGFLNPLSTDLFGQQMQAQLEADGVKLLLPSSHRPTSLAVVQISQGQPSYGFYREGIADRDYSAEQVLSLLETQTPGILHTGSLLLVPPERAGRILGERRCTRFLGRSAGDLGGHGRRGRHVLGQLPGRLGLDTRRRGTALKYDLASGHVCRSDQLHARRLSTAYLGRNAFTNAHLNAQLRRKKAHRRCAFLMVAWKLTCSSASRAESPPW